MRLPIMSLYRCPDEYPGGNAIPAVLQQRTLLEALALFAHRMVAGTGGRLGNEMWSHKHERPETAT